MLPLATLEKETIEKLVEAVDAFSKLDLTGRQSTSREDASKIANDANIDVSSLLYSCKSVEDIISRFQEFEHSPSKGELVCCVCSTLSSKEVRNNLSYNNNLPVSGQASGVFKFPEEQMDVTEKQKTKNFGNLKSHLKAHLLSKGHIECLKAATNQANMQHKEDSRNKAVGLRICRIAYYLLKLGRPDTDFTPLIYLHHVNCADIGEINHSPNFIPKFLSHVSQAVSENLKSHLGTRLVQTGQKAPVNILADKATWQHETRQGVGIVTIVPDSEQPLQGFVLGFPVVKSHTGQGVTENLTAVTDLFIKGDQLMGGSFDGQYFHQSVDKKLDEHYKVKGFYTVDPMHKCGTQDLHLREEKWAKWLVDLTSLVGRAFKIVNYGKEFLHFYEVVQALIEQKYDIKFKFPRFYSETKFANFVRLVYKSFRGDYPGIIRTFEESKARLMKGSSEDRKKAQLISEILRKILPLKFCIRLSGSCDIYERFVEGINIVQTVNILPHIKFDLFDQKVIKGLKTMGETVQPSECCCSVDPKSKDCLWPFVA